MLILVGERDDEDNLSIASILEDELPHSTKRLIEGCGHLVNLKTPEVFERLATCWLRGPSLPLPTGSAGE